MYEILIPVRCKNREKYTPKKNSHTQDRIYVVRELAYIHGVVGISLFSRKNTECGNTIFLFFFTLKNDIETLISKTIIFISCTHDSQWATKTGQKFFIQNQLISIFFDLISFGYGQLQANPGKASKICTGAARI